MLLKSAGSHFMLLSTQSCNRKNKFVLTSPKFNREEVKNREIRYVPDLSIVNLLSVFVLVQIILN